ncbi:MAG: DUF2153 family protein [Sulfolobales archaeon]
MSSRMSRILSSLGTLSEWVDMQKKAVEMFSQINDTAYIADRLTLVLVIRQAFQHMMKTLKAFDQWLNDPFILNYVTKDMLVDVWNTTYTILNTLLELDIRHTLTVKEMAEKLIREGKLPAFIELRGYEEEEGRRPTSPL